MTDTAQEALEQIIFFSRMVGQAERDNRPEDAAHHQKKVDRYAYRLNRIIKDLESKAVEGS